MNARMRKKQTPQEPESKVQVVDAAKRCAARTLDSIIYTIPGLVIYLVVTSLALLAFGKTINPVLLAFIKIFCMLIVVAGWFVLEIALLSMLGTTPGKKLLKISLLDATTGEAPSQEQMIQRTIWLYAYCGYVGIWVPILGEAVSLGCTVWQFQKLMNTGLTSYDARVGVRTVCN